jgi:hypothetical protein
MSVGKSCGNCVWSLSFLHFFYLDNIPATESLLEIEEMQKKRNQTQFPQLFLTAMSSNISYTRVNNFPGRGSGG